MPFIYGKKKVRNQLSLVLTPWGLGRVRQVIQPRLNIIEPPHDKTNKMACAPSEDSDQPGHPPSLIRIFAVRSWVTQNPSFLHADIEDSDQSGRMPS